MLHAILHAVFMVVFDMTMVICIHVTIKSLECGGCGSHSGDCVRVRLFNDAVSSVDG
jgi:hypothetical protein